MYSYVSSMYSYCCLCILIVVYVFLDAAILTEVFTCFFLGCKANARVKLAKLGYGPHTSKIVVLLYVLFVSYRSKYCLCVNVYYCHRVRTQLQLKNISYISFFFCTSPCLTETCDRRRVLVCRHIASYSMP